MSSTLRSGRAPHLLTFASSAVRLCRAARQRSIDLSGAHVTMSGEPTTPMRLAEVRRAGATGVPYYGSSEAGAALGYGCLAPSAADEVHLAHDLFAFVQPVPDVAAPAGMSPFDLLVTSLRRTAPLILLNVSLGDRAAIGPRACGCPLEGLGWTLHAHDVRSHEKLTAGGMAFLDVDLVRVLEEVLPARFGGGPTDYQLVEEDDLAGQPRLRLVVHPSIAIPDTRAVAEAFLDALGGDAGPRHVTAMLWRSSGLLVVERCPPETSRAGKILHLRVPAGAARHITTDDAGTGPPMRERS
jgi:phenylacetate-coenzyme A ligase PaaK-like adenylate-forming protein